MLALYLIDEAGDALGRGLILSRDAQGRDEFDAIGGAKIAEGVVAGDDPAALGRDLSERCLHLLVALGEFFRVGSSVLLVEFGVGGVGCGEAVRDVVYVDLAVRIVLPG